MVKVPEDRSVRTRACYLAIGVTCDGDREVLGIWWQETEGAKFWLAVLNDLHRRGVEDVLIACVDGLTGFPDAIEAVFPRPGCRPASSTRSAPRCATSPTRTAQQVAADLRPDLHRRQRRRRRSPSSSAFDEQPGASATR